MFEFTVVDPLTVNEFTDFVIICLAYLSPVLLLPICVKYICCVSAKYLGMKPNIIDDQPM